MPIVNPHAAGIDVGSESHFVCVAQDNVCEFGVFTSNLETISQHLHDHGVKTVAIESTGFYWQSLFVTLQESGFEVYLVNSRHLKNVKGHKTDVIDSRWLQMMHSIGLLPNSFQPDTFTHQIRTYVRHRRSLIQYASSYISKMNKCLTLMNIRLSEVLTDITGTSGLSVIRAIVAGERNSGALERLISLRCKASRNDIRNALQGHWRNDYLYEFLDCFELYELYVSKIEKVDKELEILLVAHTSQKKDDRKLKGHCPAYRHKHKNDPKFKIEEFVFEMTGVDLMAIDGVGFTTILTMLSETGFDLKEKFVTAKHFASWLGYCPNNKVSGGKILSSLTGMQTNPLSQAIRDAANSAGNSHSQLGDFFRRISHRKGRMVAIIATARKIAVIIYNVLTKRESFHYEGAEVNEEKIRERKIKKALKILELCNISTDHLKVDFA